MGGMTRKSKSGSKKKYKAIKVIMLGLFSVCLILILSLTAVRAMGRRNLFSKAQSQTELTLPEQNGVSNIQETQNKENWKPGWIRYEGKVYEYNEDILTFLFMGIDKDAEVVKSSGYADGGQADALFLFVMNRENETWRVVSINRNTMAEIELYDQNNNFLRTTKAQIAVQHGFGDGLEQSCEYQLRAVQRLFYNLPVHGYCAVNMDAVIDLTNLVGGVELTAIEDIYSAIQDETLGSPVVKKGETILLDGRAAYSYVRYRNIDAEGSANLRLERQQQFLGALIAKGKAALKKDLSLPLKGYKMITKKMVTDITADEVAYLAGLIAGYTPDSTPFYSLQGETVQGEEFEEFYPDEKAHFKLMIDLFYKQVEPDTK